MRRILLLVSLLAPVPAPWAGRPLRAAEADASVFFAFDDRAIPWQSNTKLTLVRADKHPENPVLRTGPEGSPDYGHAVLYGSVVRINGRFRMWYLGKIQREVTGRSDDLDRDGRTMDHNDVSGPHAPHRVSLVGEPHSPPVNRA